MNPTLTPEVEKLIAEMDLPGIIKKRNEVAKRVSTWLIGIDKYCEEYTDCIFGLTKYSNKLAGELGQVKAVADLGQLQVLISGPPGFGKTDGMQSLGVSIRAKTSRIQCDFDLKPSHVIGGSRIVESLDRSRRVVFEPGPLCSNLVLADEISRATGRTHGVFIEALEERSITPHNEYIDEKDRVVKQLPLFPISGDYTDFVGPRFFMVTFTENPHGDAQGTYPIPWAVLDRVTIAIKIDRPTLENEAKISSENVVGKSIEPCIDLNEILACAHYIYRNVKPSKPADLYRALLIRNTSPEVVAEKGSSKLVKFVLEHIEAGASTRAHFALEAVARLRAAFNQERIITPDHVKAAAVSVIAHRLVLKPGKERKISKEEVAQEVVKLTGPPPWK